jgi:DNA-binding beta-propeller fold protein YncE
MAPVEGTLAVSSDGLWGAAVLGRPDGGDCALVGWTTDPLAIRFKTPLTRGGGSSAFGSGGRRLYLACPRESEVLTIDTGTGNIVQHLRMAGRPFQVRTGRRGRAVWVLCESLGNVAIVDTSSGTATASLPLQGVADPESRIAVSPEGKLAVVPSGEGVALLNSDAGGGRYGQLEDRLDLGCGAAFAVWSPLGDEVFLIDPGNGDVLALDVDRGDVSMDDTRQCLPQRSLARDDGFPNMNPLFPP